MQTALLTGARGFIGRHLRQRLISDGWRVRVLARDAETPRDAARFVHGFTLASDSADWVTQLAGINCVFHLAGIAHRRASVADLTRVNADSPVKLFRACAAAGVGSFVWLSSIKVLGDTSTGALAESAPYAPGDPYAESKVAGERQLLAAARESPTRMAIVRTPLVYGPGVKANFRLLLALAYFASRGVPLPLGCAVAPRSILGVTNLCDFLLCAAARGSGIHHVADSRDYSVAELVTILSGGSRGPRLWRVPPGVVKTAAVILGRRAMYERLYEPLRVDQQATALALDWRPPLASEQLLDETMAWYRTQR
jgi:UDP-glucose 4-epimerase